MFTNQFGTTITNFGQLLAIIFIQVTIKTLYEVIVAPITYRLAKKIKTYENKKKEEQEELILKTNDEKLYKQHFKRKAKEEAELEKAYLKAQEEAEKSAER